MKDKVEEKVIEKVKVKKPISSINRNEVKPIKVERTAAKPIIISKPKSDPIIIVKPKDISITKEINEVQQVEIPKENPNEIQPTDKSEINIDPIINNEETNISKKIEVR
jgi:hypothetical protein